MQGLLEYINRMRLTAALLFLSAVLFFCGQRYVSGDVTSLIVTVVYSVLAFTALLLIVLAISNSKKNGLDQQARCLKLSLVWSLAFVGSFGVYLAYKSAMGSAVTPETSMQKILLGLWLLTLIVSTFSGIGVELASRDSGFGPHADVRRVKRSAGHWMLVGVVLSSFVAINFAGAVKDKASDWTYLKTTLPGSATQSMLASLEEPLSIYLFYPRGNDVLPFVESYFRNIEDAESKIKVSLLDKDLNPNQAEKMKVSRNGQIILERGEKRRRIDVGTELSKARRKLKRLDAEFQKAFLKLMETQKTIYFTAGHGEMTWLSGGENALRSLRIVEKLLREQNYKVRKFDLGKGSAVSVPEEADAVVVAGATRSFLKAEVDVLEDYVKKGGKVFVFLDLASKNSTSSVGQTGDPGSDFMDWMGRAGVTFKKSMMANEVAYVSATKSKADRWFLYTNNFSSHESVKSLARHEENIPLLLYQSGYLETKDRTGKWKVTPSVRTLRDSFADINRDFSFNKEGEQKKSYVVAAAATYNTGIKNEATTGNFMGRMIVAADANLISDAVAGAGSPANLLFMMDGLKWLVGQSEFSGETESEEDVKIRHNRNEDLIWFHSSVYGVPLFILLIGFIATRRRKVR